MKPENERRRIGFRIRIRREKEVNAEIEKWTKGTKDHSKNEKIKLTADSRTRQKTPIDADLFSSK